MVPDSEAFGVGCTKVDLPGEEVEDEVDDELYLFLIHEHLQHYRDCLTAKKLFREKQSSPVLFWGCVADSDTSSVVTSGKIGGRGPCRSSALFSYALGVRHPGMMHMPWIDAQCRPRQCCATPRVTVNHSVIK